MAHSKSLSSILLDLTLNETEIKENQFDDIVKIIINASAMLNFSVITRTKALLLYHNFERCIGDFRYESYIVAAACLSLSMKFNDEPIEVGVLILTFFDILKRPIDSILPMPLEEGELKDDSTSESENEFEVMQKSLTLMESLILRMLEFCVDHQLAHDYLLYFMNDFREKFVNLNIWDILLETTFKMASDIYLSKKCLKYKPDEIAASVIEFSLIIVGVTGEQIENEYRKKWFKILSEVSTSTKRDLWQDIFTICEVSPVIDKLLMEKIKETRKDTC